MTAANSTSPDPRTRGRGGRERCRGAGCRSGGPAGHGKGSAKVRLEAKGPDETVLHYEANASVGGKIAQIGSRLVDMAAQKMAGEFFESFNAKLQEQYGIVAALEASEAGPQSLVSRIVAWIKRLFGGGAKTQ